MGWVSDGLQNDYYGKLVLGNIKHDSIEKCWTSSLEVLRKQHKEGRAHEIEACAECPLRMSELLKGKEVDVN